jgi:hypothetical protein
VLCVRPGANHGTSSHADHRARSGWMSGAGRSRHQHLCAAGGKDRRAVSGVDHRGRRSRRRLCLARDRASRWSRAGARRHALCGRQRHAGGVGYRRLRRRRHRSRWQRRKRNDPYRHRRIAAPRQAGDHHGLAPQRCARCAVRSDDRCGRWIGARLYLDPRRRSAAGRSGAGRGGHAGDDDLRYTLGGRLVLAGADGARLRRQHGHAAARLADRSGARAPPDPHVEPRSGTGGRRLRRDDHG